MCDQKDESVLGDGLEDVHDLDCVCGVEVSCRLISDEDLAFLDECTSDCDSLHLTARESICFLLAVFEEADCL